MFEFLQEHPIFLTFSLNYVSIMFQIDLFHMQSQMILSLGLVYRKPWLLTYPLPLYVCHPCEIKTIIHSFKATAAASLAGRQRRESGGDTDAFESLLSISWLRKLARSEKRKHSATVGCCSHK